jgi:hypothetical protein
MNAVFTLPILAGQLYGPSPVPSGFAVGLFIGLRRDNRNLWRGPEVSQREGGAGAAPGPSHRWYAIPQGLISRKKAPMPLGNV